VNIIIFGPPGAGKGTQAKYLVKKLDSFQVSTGDMLREEIEKNTTIGKNIISNMNEGKFVDDEIVNKLLEKVIFDPNKMNKLIFDGYPRTINQAKNLDNLLNKSNQKIDFIFFLNVKKDSIIKRIEKRKILEKRSDDDEETILKRYDTYMDVTKPVLDFYSKKENYHEIDGSLEIDNISQKIAEILNV
tara:strand:+ start:59 stop:622 length:564 start_codon:yes stop_codon:yes gene_type:complete